MNKCISYQYLLPQPSCTCIYVVRLADIASCTCIYVVRLADIASRECKLNIMLLICSICRNVNTLIIEPNLFIEEIN